LGFGVFAQLDQKERAAALESGPFARRYQTIDGIFSDRLQHPEADFARNMCVHAHEVLVDQGRRFRPTGPAPHHQPHQKSAEDQRRLALPPATRSRREVQAAERALALPE